MKRGAGRQLQAALHSHNYANGGMVPGYANGGGFDLESRMRRPTSAPTPWVAPELTNGMFNSQGDIDAFKAAALNTGYTPMASGSLQAPKADYATAANNKAAWDWGIQHGFIAPPEHQSKWKDFTSFMGESFRNIALNPVVLAAVGAAAFPGLAAAYGGGTAGAAGAGATIGGVAGGATGGVQGALKGAATGGALAGAGSAIGGSGASGGNTQLENFSSVPSPAPTPSFGQMASGANMSTVPSGFLSGPSFMGAGAGAGAGATDPYSDPEWQRANSSQVPSQFAPTQAPEMSVAPPPNMGIGTGDAPFDFSTPSPGGNNIGANRWSGMDVSGVNPDYIPQQSTIPGNAAPSAARFTNAGFNTDAGSTSMPYGDYGDMSGGLGEEVMRNPYDLTPKTQIQAQPSVVDRILGSAKQSIAGFPEKLGAALPAAGIGLGAKLLSGRGGGGGGGGNDQALQAQQAQTATDAARNDIALNSQREFASNASKYGDEGYYNQMGDMAGMQFQAQRAQQRADMARQLQARGSDPATVDAIMRQYDLNTATGASGARNNAYLSARDRGLASQQAAAGMFPSGSSPVNQSNITNAANNRADNSTRNVTDFISQPFVQAAKNSGAASGKDLQDAGDEAARAKGDRTGLNSQVFGRQ